MPAASRPETAAALVPSVRVRGGETRPLCRGTKVATAATMVIDRIARCPHSESSGGPQGGVLSDRLRVRARKCPHQERDAKTPEAVEDERADDQLRIPARGHLHALERKDDEHRDGRGSQGAD